MTTGRSTPIPVTGSQLTLASGNTTRRGPRMIARSAPKASQGPASEALSEGRQRIARQPGVVRRATGHRPGGAIDQLVALRLAGGPDEERLGAVEARHPRRDILAKAHGLLPTGCSPVSIAARPLPGNSRRESPPRGGFACPEGYPNAAAPRAFPSPAGASRDRQRREAGRGWRRARTGIGDAKVWRGRISSASALRRPGRPGSTACSRRTRACSCRRSRKSISSTTSTGAPPPRRPGRRQGLPAAGEGLGRSRVPRLLPGAGGDRPDDATPGTPVFSHPRAEGRITGEITPAYSILPVAGVERASAINPGAEGGLDHPRSGRPGAVASAHVRRAPRLGGVDAAS